MKQIPDTIPREKKTKIIAEVASNHGGDIKIAKEFIKTAASIGLDYIKFQSWQFRKLKEGDPQRDWFKRSELTDEMHYELMNECEKRGIKFLTTVFDTERIEFLERLGMREIKVGSASASNHKMIHRIATSRVFEHIIVSTGMHYGSEIQETAGILKASGKKITLMHCVSLYPTPIEKVRMTRMFWLKNLAESVGYSDHTVGTLAVKIAIALGADYVEKHFTLGEDRCPRTMPWDATPKDFEEILEFREKFHLILGDEINPDPLPEELEKRDFYTGRFVDA